VTEGFSGGTGNSSLASLRASALAAGLGASCAMAKIENPENTAAVIKAAANLNRDFMNETS
jgi:hypothetical protein